MLIPRFTLRWMLAMTAVCAVLAFIVSLAVAEHVWAMALSMVLASVVLSFVLYAAFFTLAWACGTVWHSFRGEPKAASPFAAHSPSPQSQRPEKTVQS